MLPLTSKAFTRIRQGQQRSRWQVACQHHVFILYKSDSQRMLSLDAGWRRVRLDCAWSTAIVLRELEWDDRAISKTQCQYDDGCRTGWHPRAVTLKDLFPYFSFLFYFFLFQYFFPLSIEIEDANSHCWLVKYCTFTILVKTSNTNVSIIVIMRFGI